MRLAQSSSVCTTRLETTQPWDRQWSGTWGTTDAPLSQIEEVRDRFQTLLEEARAFPDGSAEITEVNAAIERGLALTVRAYDQYLEGIETGRFELMERGDEYFLQAQDEFLNARPEMERVVGEPEGALAEGVRDLSPYTRDANQAANKALLANADMVDALESGNWRIAGEEAAEGEAHLRETVARLEAAPEPTHESLRTFLRETIAGYRLLLAAFADYRLGIAAQDIELQDAGDRKSMRGFRRLTSASEQLAAAVKAESE